MPAKQYPHKWKSACQRLISTQVFLGLREPASARWCQGFCCERRAMYYHHPDYDQPELVIALCGECHQLFHKYSRYGE